MKKLYTILILLLIPLLLLDMLAARARTVRINDGLCFVEADSEGEAESVTEIDDLLEEDGEFSLHGYSADIGLSVSVPTCSMDCSRLACFPPFPLWPFGWTVPLRI